MIPLLVVSTIFPIIMELFMFIGIGILIFIIVQLIEVSFFRAITPFIYAAGLLLLFGVLFTKPINGATSWYSLGGSASNHLSLQKYQQH